MMDYQTLETMMQSPETIAIGVGAIAGSIGAVAGYLTARYTSNSRLKQSQLNKDVRIEEEKTKQAEYETLREQAKTDVEKSRAGVELKKLDYGYANEEHQRKLELMAREREYKSEDEKISYERQKEQAEVQMQETEKQRGYDAEQAKSNRATRLQQTIEISDRLRPVLEQYVQALQNFPQETPDENYEKQREDCRRKFVDEAIEYIDDNSEGFMYQIVEENKGIDEDVRARINELVDLKFPPKQTNNRVPAELKTNLEKLISLLGL